MPRMDCRGNHLTRSRKGRSGFTAVIGVVVLLGLVAVIGSVALIWGNNFNVEKQKLGDYYVTNVNKIKEMIVIEDVWLSTFPANTGVVVIRNVGDIAIKVSEVKMNVLDSAGGAACTVSCESGTSASNAVKSPFTPDSTDGLISSKQTLVIAVDKIDWDHTNSKDLEVFITTDRGSIIWRVYDWRGDVPQVITCNGLPVTIIGTAGDDDLEGADGDDVIAGLGGSDSIQGYGGDDTLCGGNGNDLLFGGAGDDVLLGENEDDITLDGGPGNDRLDGGSGIDIICINGEVVVNCNP